MHLPPLVEDLAIILIVAAFVTLIFKAIKQPVILGYIFSGFLVGPHFKWLPNIVDDNSVKVWAEIGVIFLLFALGLDFSFKKLMRVGGQATFTAITETLGLFSMGFLTGQIFSWTPMESLFLGGIVAISSTSIIVRTFEEQGLKTMSYARLVYGVLVIEDLAAILLIVILSTIAHGRAITGADMAQSVLKLFFFLTLWFILGIFLIPSFLKRARQYLNQETLLIVSLGFCFLMVVTTTKVGFSASLGAFIMGSIFAETIHGERIEQMIQSLKDLFGAIFFVSVGILIDPTSMINNIVPILVITLIVIVGKITIVTIGSLFTGETLKHSVQAGVNLAQIGEFSFIIAALGRNLHVTGDFLFPVAIGISLLTTFLNPYLRKNTDHLVHFIENHLHQSILNLFAKFRLSPPTAMESQEWNNVIRHALLKMLLNAVIITSLFLWVKEYFVIWLMQHLQNAQLSRALGLLTAFSLSTPFLWALTLGRLYGVKASILWGEKKFKALLFVFEISRWILTLILCAVLSSLIVSAYKVVIGTMILVLIGIFYLSKHFRGIYIFLESRFIHNLNEKELAQQAKKLPRVAPWDSHLAEIKVSSNSQMVGKKLSEVMIRERFGVSIALIVRGNKLLPAPGRNEVLYPADQLHFIGTDEQIQKFKNECELEESSPVDLNQLDFTLKPVYVTADAYYANKSIRHSGLRENTQSLVVGIEKRGQRTLNPDSLIIIEPGDILWLVGNKKLMEEL